MMLAGYEGGGDGREGSVCAIATKDLVAEVLGLGRACVCVCVREREREREQLWHMVGIGDRGGVFEGNCRVERVFCERGSNSRQFAHVRREMSCDCKYWRERGLEPFEFFLSRPVCMIGFSGNS